MNEQSHTDGMNSPAGDFRGPSSGSSTFVEDNAEQSFVRERSCQHIARLSILSDVENIAPVYGRPAFVVKPEEASHIRLEDNIFSMDDLLDQGVESLEYDVTQNNIFNEELTRMAVQPRRWQIGVLRYLILLIIGFLTGLSAFTFDYCIETLSHAKFQVVSDLLQRFNTGWDAAIPGIVWCAFNAGLIAVCATMVVFFAPVAAGSGIPQIKCYLNGVNVPKVMRGLTMFVKGIGVVLSVSGGLAVGKEGPMIHVGSAIAAGVSQGRFTWCKYDIKFFKFFRNNAEKRDFVSAGAAAGVAAAFGAPVGGLLFALEEGASFVNQRITWAILFCSTISLFSLGALKSLIGAAAAKFSAGSMLSFGSLTFLSHYSVYEVILFMMMGIFGGLLGALFVYTNLRLTKYRHRYINTKLSRIIEAVLISVLTAAIGYTLMWLIPDCSPVAFTGTPCPTQMMCAHNEFSSVGSLFFSTPERSLRTLFHDPPSTFNLITLMVFCPLYYLLTCVTYGLAVPSGLFIPSLLVGAGWGRIVGNLLHLENPTAFPDPGKFALIGAAAQLGGIVRMTVSLTVIIMEATGSVTVGLPVLITLLFAKYTADYFNEGIYDVHIGLSSMALLPWEPDPYTITKRAYNVMSSPVCCLHPVMRVSEMVMLIRDNLHHGFPVVEGPVSPARFSYGTLVGLISAEHLALLLHKRVFCMADETPMGTLNFRDYDAAYPRFKRLKDVIKELTDEDMEAFIDIRPYMNEAAYCVNERMVMTRVFRLFRSLGLRHLPVVDNRNQVRGMITRKDLCRFRIEATQDSVHVEELAFSRRM